MDYMKSMIFFSYSNGTFIEPELNLTPDDDNIRRLSR
jgi:hypothetical protein